LTLPSWLRRAGHCLRRIWSDDLLDLAAQIAFYQALGLFPFLIFFLALLGLLPIDGVVKEGLAMARGIVPHRALSLVAAWIEEVRAAGGVPALSFGVVATLWTGSAGVSAFLSAFACIDSAADFTIRRHLWLRLAITLSGAVLLALFLVGWVLWPALAGPLFVVLGRGTAPAWSGPAFRIPVLFTASVLGLATAYRYLSPLRPTFRASLGGAAVAVVLFGCLSQGFVVYLRNFSDYDRTYGSLAGFMILLLWFYTLNLAILVGKIWIVTEIPAEKKAANTT
jgi:membrane protein